MTLKEGIAIRINELLKKQDMTQYSLSIKSGVCATSISDIRHQKNNTSALNIIYQIAQGFGMTLKEFFDCELFSYDNITD